MLRRNTTPLKKNAWEAAVEYTLRIHFEHYNVVLPWRNTTVLRVFFLRCSHNRSHTVYNKEGFNDTSKAY